MRCSQSYIGLYVTVLDLSCTGHSRLAVSLLSNFFAQPGMYRISCTFSWVSSFLVLSLQISGLQPSPSQSWLGSQGSSSGLIVKRTIRVDIPVDHYPNVWISLLYLIVKISLMLLMQTFVSASLQFNFVGRLLGPRGNSLKRVEASTDCRVLIRGRGSIKDPVKVSFQSS